jgi:hypothetical protein
MADATKPPGTVPYFYTTTDVYTEEEKNVLRNVVFNAVGAALSVLVEKKQVEAAIEKFGAQFSLKMLKGYSSLQLFITTATQAVMDNTDLFKDLLFPRRTPQVHELIRQEFQGLGRVNRGVRIPLIDQVSSLDSCIELAPAEMEELVANRPQQQQQQQKQAPTPPQSQGRSTTNASTISGIDLVELSQVEQSLTRIVLSYEKYLLHYWSALMNSLTKLFAEHSTENDPTCLYQMALVDADFMSHVTDQTNIFMAYLYSIDEECRVMSCLLARSSDNAHEKGKKPKKSRHWSATGIVHGAFPLHITHKYPGTVFVHQINALMDGPSLGASSSKHGQPILINASHPDSLATSLTGKKPAVYVKRHAKSKTTGKDKEPDAKKL